MSAVLNKTREERKTRQEEWKEFNLIVRRCNQLKFDYVILPQFQQTEGLCFGSTIPREVLPMQKAAATRGRRVGPGSYYTYRILPPQVVNPTSFYSKVMRFSGVHPTRMHDEFYEIEPLKTSKQRPKSFGIGSKGDRLNIAVSGVPG